MKSFYALLIFILGVAPLAGQENLKEVTNQNLIWVGYYNRLEISPKWNLSSEIQERRYVFPDKQHQFLLRAQLYRKVAKDWQAGVTFTYFLQSPQDPKSTSNLIVPELRPSVQLGGKYNFSPRLELNHRYELEMRFFRNVADGELADGYHNNFRARYRVGLSFTVTPPEKNAVKLKVSDEILINFGEGIVYNHFDQNRIYVAVSYDLSPHFSIETGYLNWYQQRASGTDFYNRNILRLGVQHRLKYKQKNS